VLQAIDWKAWTTMALIRHDSLPREGGQRSRTRGPRRAGGAQPRRAMGRVVWECTMRRLRVTVRLLSVIGFALIVRMAVTGPTPTTVLALSVVAALLIAGIRLIRYGHRIEP
jgi:hypothetical protein